MSQWTHVDGERTRAVRFTTIYEVKFRWCSDISTWGLYSLIETARDAVHREVMPRYESQYAQKKGTWGPDESTAFDGCFY